MIERYTISSELDQIEKKFGAKVPKLYQKRYNAAPTQLLPVITSMNPYDVSFFYWGIEPGLSKNKRITTKLANAPVDALLNKITYKNSLTSRRCIILADGFYVWKSTGKKGQIPYRVIFQTKELFSIAGLWDSYETIDGKQIQTFTLITQEANSVVKKISDYMPAILTTHKEEQWLNNEMDLAARMKLLSELEPVSLTSFAVTPKVNNLANDGPELILPAPPADQFGNYSLFD